MKRILFSSQHLSKKFSFFLAAVVFAAFLSPTQAMASRNGVEQPSNTFTVGITFKFGAVDQLCSGAMLTPTLVVTAGHCAYGINGESATNYLFTSPGTALDAAIDPRIVQPKVIKVFTDPTFSTKDANNVNDIAFLQLDKPVVAKNYLRFATRSELEQLTSSSALAGYGYGQVFETGATYSIYPRKYEMKWNPIDSATVLANTFSLTSANAGPCKGDSGGPIVATLPSGKEVLVGALSGANNVLGGCINPAADGLFYIRLTTGYPFLSLIATIYDPTAPVVVPSPSASASPKKITIKCKKGSVIKKVTAVKPVCPKGYKKVS